MKKKRPVDMDRVMAIAAPIIKKRSEAANEMVTDIGKQIMEDQTKWLDSVMKDILPPNLYEAGKLGDLEVEIGDYLRKHNIRLIFIPDALVLRVMIGDRVHAQFVPQILCDGEPVKVEATGFLPDVTNN